MYRERHQFTLIVLRSSDSRPVKPFLLSTHEAIFHRRPANPSRPSTHTDRILVCECGLANQHDGHHLQEDSDGSRAVLQREEASSCGIQNQPGDDDDDKTTGTQRSNSLSQAVALVQTPERTGTGAVTSQGQRSENAQEPDSHQANSQSPAKPDEEPTYSSDTSGSEVDIPRHVKALTSDVRWNVLLKESCPSQLPSPPPTPLAFRHISKRHIIRTTVTETYIRQEAISSREVCEIEILNLKQQLIKNSDAVRCLEFQMRVAKETLERFHYRAKDERNLHKAEVKALQTSNATNLEYNNWISKELFLARGNIYVIARIRGKISSDKDQPLAKFSQHHKNDLTLAPMMAGKKPRSYTFDHVFPSTSTNQEVSQKVEPMVRAVMEGYNVCVIVDGQSGAGKSYTMFDGEYSIASFAATQILSWKDVINTQERFCRVQCSVIEILADTPYDLLASKGLRDKIQFQIQNLPQKTVCKGLQSKDVRTSEELMCLLKDAVTSRKVESTDKNSSSSRGHAITILTLIQSPPDEEPAISQLFLVDLAGSERRQETNNKEAIREASTISTDRESLKKMFIAHGKRGAGKNIVLNRDTKVCL